ncbi:hypothetical protein VIGAN_05232600 [Vigna angularis var. angularis]|uniref:Uncharacterized protein n=1 Tax=Vigna angularis var. angularis TaxID=157739 RepID=A0A0S3S7C6_PHAAN|nr:hypothetical protein VIGAN_05232600 [Vigna angularis var. angularis]
MEAIVKARNCSVLGKGSILKMYFFPGQRTSSHIQIHGAPHVFKVDEYPVYCMATLTISVSLTGSIAFTVCHISTITGIRSSKHVMKKNKIRHSFFFINIMNISIIFLVF